MGLNRNTARNLFEAKMALALQPLTRKQREAEVCRLERDYNPGIQDSSLRTAKSECNTMYRMRSWHKSARRYADMINNLYELLETPPTERTRYEHIVLDHLRAIKRAILAGEPVYILRE